MLCVAAIDGEAVVVKTVMHHFSEIKFSDRPIVREVPQDWNICLSYDAEGKVVEMVILEAKATGAWPVKEQKRAA